MTIEQLLNKYKSLLTDQAVASQGLLKKPHLLRPDVKEYTERRMKERSETIKQIDYQLARMQNDKSIGRDQRSTH